ncbi:LytTR family DNA-binding domain-containing protein [Cytophagaceae bacterium DM2B3-1]|uniref:LytTR family DNA-binding domain-containing protein n=1 Tax=Xanthocytophaga flava TaxID=3048013 RepID=A0ABT7CK71_9BACT|nr:LytTR family DNA-binding domain-containing protein [Xanthocytophaga flavus]MDJ1469356.1 LytTR family DNA-binding domain-containing protein [Xanthocytophaga flavus]MDJ1494132.1 LytTR family DNA-binding domain-containing protein [Xanthocytophaga flavus]
MKAVLIDDEQHNLDNLTALLAQYCPQVEVSATALDAETGKNFLYEHQPDLLFLDIQMPGQTGFGLLQSLSHYDFEVIFVTAYDQHAIQAFRFAAVDYLLKPVDITLLQSAVQRAMKQRLLKVHNQQLENLMHLLKTQQVKEDQRIALATTKETHFVRVSDIIRCESSNNYTTFSLTDEEELLVCKPIYEYEDILKDYGFIRCHQSHLVNKKYIRSWKKEYGDFLLLTNGKEIPVSRGKKEEVKKALQF